MRQKSVVSVSIEPLVDLLDDLPDVSFPDLDAPDLSAMTDALADATLMATDAAAVVGRHSGKVVSRTASAAWRHRRGVATVAVVAVVLVALMSLMKRSDDDAPDEP